VEPWDSLCWDHQDDHCAPKEHQFKKTGSYRKPRGEMKAVKTELDDTPLYYTAWMDKKPVHILSTFSASVDVVRRNSKSARGQYEPLELRRPAIFLVSTTMVWAELTDSTKSFLITELNCER
jgi:hypothetical protein